MVSWLGDEAVKFFGSGLGNTGAAATGADGAASAGVCAGAGGTFCWAAAS